MPPIWLCVECEGVAYGWARGGPCIYCGDPRVVATDGISEPSRAAPDYRLLCFTDRQWAQLEAESILAGQSPRDRIAEREGMEVVLIREEPVQHGQLVLLKTDSQRAEAGRQE